MMEGFLAAVFLLAIPVNVYVAREVRRYAHIPPEIATLSLLSRLVTLFAVIAVALGILATNAVLFLLTGIRPIPTPVPTIALVGVLILVSLANVLVWRYLRRMRGVA